LVSGGLGDQSCFVEHQRGGGQLAGEHVASGQKAERERQVPECARVARDLNSASRE
jgi:hypothetical protein